MTGPRTITEERKDIPEKILLDEGDQLELRSGKYQVLAGIGRGGFAHVYSIRRPGQTRILAIKILVLWEVRPNEYDDLVRKFEQEYRAGQVDSRFVVRSYEMGRVAGNPYITMDYCPNGSLAKRLGEFAEPARYEKLATSILTGLSDLHREGIIHRDLKPENILFDEHDDPRLTDFGISGHLHNRVTSRNLIGFVRQVWGTPLYSPPEQLSHHKAFKLTAPTMDVFSFGVMMYEVISSGHHPYGDRKELLEDTREYLRRVNEELIVPLEQHQRYVSRKWIDIIRTCLQPKPQNRYPSAEAVLQAIGVSSNGQSVQSGDVPPADSIHAVLKVVEGENVGHIYYLVPAMESANSKELRLGWADPDDHSVNHIRLPETGTRFISRHHATLSRTPSGWFLQDGQRAAQEEDVRPSTNGTFVNFKPVTGQTGHQLQDGDVISIGNARLKFILL